MRKYLEASLLTMRAARRLLRQGRYDAVVLHHGIYVPQGLLTAAATAEGARVVTWNMAYRKRCFIFSHDDTYHHTMMDEPVDTWAAMDWPAASDKRLGSYLASRAGGMEDWISFYREPAEDFAAIAGELGIDLKKPIVLMLTNVIWDAQLHYPGNAFPTMLDWIVTTVEHFAGRPDLQLVIRVHPAEVTGAIPSRQRVVEELAKRFPVLPPNVVLVPPEHPASSYVIAAHSIAALVYASRMGVELAARGLPVIVAGEAWVKHKGFTRDARDRDDYLRASRRTARSGDAVGRHGRARPPICLPFLLPPHDPGRPLPQAFRLAALRGRCREPRPARARRRCRSRCDLRRHPQGHALRL